MKTKTRVKAGSRYGGEQHKIYDHAQQVVK
jgi:hypothetical protein